MKRKLNGASATSVKPGTKFLVIPGVGSALLSREDAETVMRYLAVISSLEDLKELTDITGAAFDINKYREELTTLMNQKRQSLEGLGEKKVEKGEENV